MDKIKHFIKWLQQNSEEFKNYSTIDVVKKLNKYKENKLKELILTYNNTAPPVKLPVHNLD